MTSPEVDQRSPARRRRTSRSRPSPRWHRPSCLLTPSCRPSRPTSVNSVAPVAVAGIVENGLVRPLDAAVKLPEHARVIIVATEAI